MQNKATITYSIEQVLDAIFNAWNLVAVHDDGTKRVVLYFLTEKQAQQALQRLDAMMAAENI
jgi:hypothetical protein